MTGSVGSVLLTEAGDGLTSSPSYPCAVTVQEMISSGPIRLGGVGEAVIKKRICGFVFSVARLEHSPQSQDTLPEALY